MKKISEKGSIGRQTLLTPERQERIIQAIKIGSYNEVAAQYAGISEKTFYNWMSRGEDGEEPYVQFLQAVKDAQAQAEIRDLTLITRAADDGNWQAAAWKLERKNYMRWGRKDKMMLEGGDPNNPIKVDGTSINTFIFVDPPKKIDED